MGSWQNPYKTEVETSGHSLILDQPESGWQQADIKSFISTSKKYRALFLEFGSGSGQHLIAQAAANPTNFYLGVELRYKRCVRAAQKAALEGLENILFFRGDGVALIHSIEENLLDGIFILFPDPWEKPKWQKNRILQAKNLPLFLEKLKVGGTLHYRTDHAEYFSSAVSLLKSQSEWGLNYVTYDMLKSEYRELTLPSEFELLFRSQQKPIHAIEVIKG